MRARPFAAPLASRVAAAAGLALVLGACGPDIPPPKPLPPPPPPSNVEASATAGEDSQQALYVYSPVGKRDPFRDMFGNAGKIVVVDEKLKASGKLTALQRFEIDQLKLAFTNTATSSPMAMVLDPTGKGHMVHIGDFIGKNWGKVSHIGREELTVTETIADQQTGRVYPVYIPMRMPKSDTERQNEDKLDFSVSASEGNQ